MSNALISVVIPVYNGDAYLARAAESVLRQPSADRLQLLLVDDGSTDGSGAICDRLASDFPAADIRVFHQENGGVAAARNLGIQEAQGSYIAFLDADDWWDEAFLDASLVEALTDGFDLYCFSYRSISPDCRWCKLRSVSDARLTGLAPDPQRAHPIAHWSCLYRREYLLTHQIRYLPCRINEDVPFVHLAATFAQSICFWNRIMLNYWVNPNSCIHTHNTQRQLEEGLRSMQLEESCFQQMGFPGYSNQRSALSLILTRMPQLCCEMHYRSFLAFVSGSDCDLLRQEQILPWQNLLPRLRLFRRHPFLFWLRARFHPGFALMLKRALVHFRPLHSTMNLIQYRFLFHWSSFHH